MDVSAASMPVTRRCVIVHEYVTAGIRRCASLGGDEGSATARYGFDELAGGNSELATPMLHRRREVKVLVEVEVNAEPVLLDVEEVAGAM